MPRAPSEKVTQAEKLFNDGMAMVEIAKKLEVSDGTVRSWKNRYGWGKASKKNKCNVAKKNEKKNATLQKKKRGGQPKNQNAKGGSGNPNPNPPPDRTKHGGYVPVFMDALDSDEQELLGSIPEDTELQLMEQIQLFSIRERRILKTPEDAAIRETREEFGINIANIIPVTLISGMSEQYCPSQVFLCTEYYGNPICFNTEMEDARFEDVGSVLDMDLFLPFRLSLEDFLRQLDEIRLTAEVSQSNMEADGGPGSGRYPKGSGKKNEKSGSKKKKSQSLPMTAKEKAKVTHDINNVYHAKYKGKSSCYIRTHSNEPDSPAYVYRFRNHGFDDYEIYMKESTD